MRAARLDSRAVLRRGTSASVVRQAVTFVATVIATPVLVQALGLQRYGVWALVAGLAAIGATLDLGLRAAIVKSVAELDARGDRDALGAVAGNGVLVYGGLGIVLIIAFAAGCALALDVLRVPPALRDEASRAVAMAGLYAAMSLWVVFAAGFLEGLQRVAFSQGIFAWTAAVTAAATSLAARAGCELAALPLIHAAVGAGALVVLVLTAWRTTRARHGRIRLRFDAQALRRDLRYAGAVLGSTLAHASSQHLGKLLLGRYAGLEAASLYDIALRVAFGLRLVPTLLMTAIVPVVSSLAAALRFDAVLRLYRTLLRATAAVALITALVATVALPQILRLWLGAVPEGLVFAARILAVSHLANSVLGVPLFVARGLGAVHFEARLAAAHCALHALLGVILVRTWGLPGALVADTTVLLGGTLLGFAWMHRGLGDVLGEARTPAFPPIPIGHVLKGARP